MFTNRGSISCMKHPIELQRKKIGLSRGALAAQLGISYSLATEIERGQRWRDGVPHVLASRLAAALHLTKEEVVFWRHPKNSLD